MKKRIEMRSPKRGCQKKSAEKMGDNRQDEDAEGGTEEKAIGPKRGSRVVGHYDNVLLVDIAQRPKRSKYAIVFLLGRRGVCVTIALRVVGCQSFVKV